MLSFIVPLLSIEVNFFFDTSKHTFFTINKEKFKDDILFISFDMNTLVILCANESSKTKLKSYFQSLKKGES